MTTAQPLMLIADRYLVSETLAEGAGSLVLRGEDRVLKRQVVIKRVAPEYAATYRAALGATARIGHPAYVGIFDSLMHDDQLIIVQELIRGQTFTELARAELAPVAIAKFGRQLALALAHAHRQGIAHGDLVPAALFRDQWGAARINNVLLPPDTAYFAAAGRILTTAPWPNEAPAPRADLRAMGIALWLLLARQDTPPPTATGTEQDWDLVSREVPAALRDVITRLVDTTHQQTLATAEAAIKALSATLLALDTAQAQRGTTPPWDKPALHLPAPALIRPPPAPVVPRPAPESAPDAATVPTILAVSQPIKPPHSVSYPMVVGPPPPRSTNDDATWAAHEGIGLRDHLMPNHAKQHLPTKPARTLDFALWAGLAIALFLFWLVIGYLVPGIFGK